MSLKTIDDIRAMARNLGLESMASDGLVIWSRDKNERALRALQDMLVAADKSFVLYFTSGDTSPRIHVCKSTLYPVSDHYETSQESYDHKIDDVLSLARLLKLPMRSFSRTKDSLDSLRIYKNWTNPAQVEPFAKVLLKVQELGLPYTIDNESDFELSYIVIPFQEPLDSQ